MSLRKTRISGLKIRHQKPLSHSITDEMCIDSNRDCPKISQNITSIQPIRIDTNDLISECNIDIISIPVQPT